MQETLVKITHQSSSSLTRYTKFSQPMCRSS